MTNSAFLLQSSIILSTHAFATWIYKYSTNKRSKKKAEVPRLCHWISLLSRSCMLIRFFSKVEKLSSRMLAVWSFPSIALLVSARFLFKLLRTPCSFPSFLFSSKETNTFSMVCIVSTVLLWSDWIPWTSSLAWCSYENPPSSTPLEVETACRAALFWRTRRRDLANSSGPAMFSQQMAEDGGSQKRWEQFTGFSGVSVTKGLSAGKLWSRCRRDDPDPHSQSSRSGSPDSCSGRKGGGGPAALAPTSPSRREQHRQSTAQLTAPWSISKPTKKTPAKKKRCVSWGSPLLPEVVGKNDSLSWLQPVTCDVSHGFLQQSQEKALSMWVFAVIRGKRASRKVK